MFVKRFTPPYLVFNTAPVDGGGESTPPELGFPADTPLTEMTVEQQAAYWRNEAKKQQRRADGYSKLGDPETVAQKLQEADAAAETARKANLTEHEQAVEAARAEGRTEGEKSGNEKLLSAAVTSAVIAHVKGAGESYEDASKRVSDALAFVDVAKFRDENGDLDAAKVQTFSMTLGSGADEQANVDPSRFVAHGVASGFKHQPGGGAGSVNALMDQYKQRKGIGTN